MPDLRWDEVRPFFDPELMGTLPDVVIEETGVEDWQALLDLIGSQGWSVPTVALLASYLLNL
jgi:hypothetical protein